MFEVVEEYNDVWARFLGLRFNVWHWKPLATPGLDEDTQKVITKSIPRDYDVFLGILNARFGTPTPRAESGTEEEFSDAVKRRTSNSELSILFYFKQSELPRDVDTVQLNRVRDFKNRIGKEGLFYCEYLNTNDFEKYVRIHLCQQAQSYWSTFGDESIKKTLDEVLVTVTCRKDDNGELSFHADESTSMEKVEEASEYANNMILGAEYVTLGTAHVNRITDLFLEQSASLVASTEEMSQLKKKFGNNFERPLRAIVNRLASSLARTTKQMKSELDECVDAYEKGVGYMMKSLAVPIVIMVDKESGVTRNDFNFHSAAKSSSATIESLERFFGDLGPVAFETPAFRRARVELREQVQKYIVSLQRIRDLWRQVAVLADSNWILKNRNAA
ncbi:MAG: hypothetical protein H6508_00455 [Calditrichaeota bacterium]|nr:hypothetical protein [Calditrichota bacterium]MCB9365644.1 hypothetical protein [Calditrichota bacterium]